MSRVIIADDEPLLRFHLQKTLEDVWTDCDVLDRKSTRLNSSH